MCLSFKIKKSEPASRKTKKVETETIYFKTLAQTALKNVTIKIPSTKLSTSTHHTTELHNSHFKQHKQDLTTKSPRSLPTPDTVYPPRKLLNLDFSFYNTVS